MRVVLKDDAERANFGHFLQLEERAIFPHQVWKLRPFSTTRS